jgi:hypothetical protein
MSPTSSEGSHNDMSHVMQRTKQLMRTTCKKDGGYCPYKLHDVT